jgi:hypothetical protein
MASAVAEASSAWPSLATTQPIRLGLRSWRHLELRSGSCTEIPLSSIGELVARSKTRSITLKGNLAKIFVEGHNPKAEDTEDQILERIALAIHMDMATGQVQRAVATLKALKSAAQSGVSKSCPTSTTS